MEYLLNQFKIRTHTVTIADHRFGRIFRSLNGEWHLKIWNHLTQNYDEAHHDHLNEVLAYLKNYSKVRNLRYTIEPTPLFSKYNHLIEK